VKCTWSGRERHHGSAINDRHSALGTPCPTP
jgi:hypothetical protein